MNKIKAYLVHYPNDGLGNIVRLIANESAVKYYFLSKHTRNEIIEFAKEFCDLQNYDLQTEIKNELEFRIMQQSETLEVDTTLPQTEQPQETKKEFVIDVKNLNIKDLIKNATENFVNTNSEKILDKVMTKRINEAVQRLQPTYVKIGERKQIKLQGRAHKAFKECLFLAQHERQLFISGPAGSGKTTLGEQIAKALDLKFGFISCSAGLSEAHLLGRMLFDGKYVPSDFITLYEAGGVFLLDEVDAADANTMLTINSALANGIVSVPNRKDKSSAKRHKDFILIASGNTWGNGSFEYHGRNHLDAAFLDRFALSRVEVDYDKQLEKEITSVYPELSKALWEIRDNCSKNKIRKVVSTRAFISGVRQMDAGKELKEILQRFFVGWSKEEISKVIDFNKLGTEEEIKTETDGQEAN